MDLANLLGDTIFPYLRENKIPTLPELAATGRLKPGSDFTVEGAFSTKGLTFRGSNPLASASKPMLELPSRPLLTIEFSKNNLITNTAYAKLQGRPDNLFIFATITEATDRKIRAVPYFIAELVENQRFGLTFSNICNLQLSDIDQFSSFDLKWSPTINQFKKLKYIPEAKVKAIFADIFGEFDVSADWGGEEADLFTANMSVGGIRRTAAFLLKGPAKFHEMMPKDCGKNGDQIYRMFNIQADIYVVQHCHRISPAVRKTVETFVMGEYRTNCKCLFIDGSDTAKILRAKGVKFGRR